VSAFWAPNAILLAALVLTPLRQWWVHLTAVCIVHFAAQLPVNPPAQVVIQFFGNSGLAVIGAAALHRFTPIPPRFDRLWTTMNLILVAGIAAPLATSLLMAAAFVRFGIPMRDFSLTVAARTATNTFAILTLVPLIVHLPQAIPDWRKGIRWKRAAEGLLLVVSLATVSVLVFVIPRAGPGQSPALLYVPFPFLLWAAVRFGTTGVCGCMLVMGALASWGAVSGYGPFVREDTVDDALSVLFFIVVTSIPLMLLAALFSERKVTTAALIESEIRRRGEHELHSAVMASLEDQIAVLDKDGKVIEVNAAWRLNAVRSRESIHSALPGSNYLDTLARSGDPALTRQIADALVEVLSAQCLRRKLEYAVRTAEGVQWVEHSIERLMRPEGGAVLTVSDATDRKNAEREAQVRLRQLAHLSRVAAIGEISGAIAHEVNQPLSAILGNAEAALRLLASDDPPIEDVKEILRDIASNDLRASNVIKRVRLMLRNDELRLEPVALNNLVKEVLMILHVELEQRNVTLQTDLPPSAGQVKGDPVQLQQVVMNLIMNACEAMSASPESERRLYISTREGPLPGEVELVIRDFGPGIPSDQRERIFHPFVTTKGQGMGLGLSISRSIVKAHGGRLWAESSTEGAVFRMALRRLPSPKEEPAPPGGTEGRPNGRDDANGRDGKGAAGASARVESTARQAQDDYGDLEEEPYPLRISQRRGSRRRRLDDRFVDKGSREPIPIPLSAKADEGETRPPV
jgi:two-component system sensor kinase FixL